MGLKDNHALLPSRSGAKDLADTPGAVQAAAVLLLDTLAELCEHARSVNADRLRRRALAVAQLADKARPPLLLRNGHC